jgi:hypothetical protein
MWVDMDGWVNGWGGWGGWRDGGGMGWGNMLTAGEDDPFDVCFVGEFVPG